MTLGLSAAALTGCSGDATGVDESAAELAGVYDLETVNGEQAPWGAYETVLEVDPDLSDGHYYEIVTTQKVAVNLTLRLDGTFQVDETLDRTLAYLENGEAGEPFSHELTSNSGPRGTWSVMRDVSCRAACSLTVVFEYSLHSDPGTALAGVITVISGSETRVYRKRS